MVEITNVLSWTDFRRKLNCDQFNLKIYTFMLVTSDKSPSPLARQLQQKHCPERVGIMSFLL
jgi:hypothetical protein